jgi:hypothetical protein
LTTIVAGLSSVPGGPFDVTPLGDDGVVNDEHDNRTEDFLVALGGGGGPVPFHQALARKFRELALWRSYCAILSPIDRPMHYVQAMVTAAGVRVESVGSRYLHESDEDDFTADQVATLVEVHDLDANEPVHLQVFPATNEHYRWEVDTHHPCGGQLTAV